MLQVQVLGLLPQTGSRVRFFPEAGSYRSSTLGFLSVI